MAKDIPPPPPAKGRKGLKTSRSHFDEVEVSEDNFSLTESLNDVGYDDGVELDNDGEYIDIELDSSSRVPADTDDGFFKNTDEGHVNHEVVAVERGGAPDGFGDVSDGNDSEDEEDGDGGVGSDDGYEEYEFETDILRSVDSLLTYITDDSCTEVLINGPNECSRKVQGTRYHSPDVRFGDADTYHAVLNRFVLPYCDTPERIDGKNVVIEGQLELSIPPGRPPMYARVHIIAPPGVKYAKVTIAKKPRTSITVDKMVKGGTLSQNAADFLKAVSRGHKTMVVSGPTGAGKSTMLQALTYYFDPSDRVVVVEETPELQLPLGDVVYLKSTLELPGQDPSKVYSLEFWVKQANRMRMDRVIVGETRGAELAEWLIAANSGAEGSATTVHAETPRRTLDKMLSLAAKGSTTVSENQIRREIAATVDVIVQLGFVNNRHVVTAIEEVSNTIANQTGQIQTNTIFAFDRETNTHVVKGRPSDGLIRSLAAQGIPVNQQWFQTGNV